MSLFYLAKIQRTNLHLTSRAWRSVAAEGLFNVFTNTSTIFKEIPDGYTIRGILVIRPWRTYRSVADELLEYPWMAQHVKEIQIFLPDKNVNDVVATGGFAIGSTNLGATASEASIPRKESRTLYSLGPT